MIRPLTLALLLSAGCAARPSAHPISESHSQITATMYDDAENHFADVGDMVPPTGWTAAECQKLLDKRDTASAVVLGLVGLGGAGGLAALLPKDTSPAEARQWELGLGISTLAVGTTAVILGAMVRSWSATFERECNTARPLAGAEPTVYEHPVADEVEPDGGVN